MDSQYLMRRKCITSCFVYQSFSICLVNRFNLIQTVGGKINWNCNGGHDGQDAVCFSAFHFQLANLAIPLIEYWHKIVCSGLKLFNYISESKQKTEKPYSITAFDECDMHFGMCLKGIKKSIIQSPSGMSGVNKMYWQGSMAWAHKPTL